jgi:hypothetical protein
MQCRDEAEPPDLMVVPQSSCNSGCKVLVVGAGLKPAPTPRRERVG